MVHETITLLAAFTIALGATEQCHEPSPTTPDRSPMISLFDGVLTVPRDYNKNVQPPGSPAVVYIGFIVSDIMEVNDDEYTISMKVDDVVYRRCKIRTYRAGVQWEGPI